MKPEIEKKRKTSFKAIVLMFVGTIFTSAGQIFLKSGVDSASNILAAFNFALITGLLLYAFALVLVLKAYKEGELSVLYPIFALSYIWVILLASFIFGEVVSTFKLLGIIAIFIGITLIGIGGR